VPLMEERIKTHIDEHQRDGHNAIRISTHVYNTMTEIDRLLEAVATA
ncbi:MAG TPA: aminotransferase class V-fold PLP-dependent enzyme, partial [Candidatus Marinimicrobia bacterium]|nr:aminotransferase class V-fold PLP-dependent enzyme [Candidatus Neomarinimicrobiota bacterium]HIO74652.1 aminotransferase class V-fold PLP-dependent enzyme [Candidatus Neomarinimicrobiota bacterium]